MKKDDLKKIDLPDYDKLDYEFEISEIESEHFLLRNIRKRIYDKFETSLKFLEDIIQPTAMDSMIEFKELEEKDITKAFDIYKKIMIHLRKASKLFFSDSDKENTEFINAAYNDWIKIKEELIELNEKLSKCWVKPSIKKERLKYLG